MRVRLLLLTALSAFGSSPVWCAVQVQTTPAACDLPPPLACPPLPPSGPKTARPEIDRYIEGLDAAILRNGSVVGDNASRSRSPAANAEIKKYVKDLEDYRQEVVEYRESLSPGFDETAAASEKTDNPE